MQVFFWIGPGVTREDKLYYQSFQLNGVNYNIGDSVYLFPENEHHPHYIGRIVSAFVDEHSGHADPHCIQVKWFERRVNLEESTRGIEESEREVFELEDVDINPIGCISGKNFVVKARAYDEAYQRMRGVTDTDWYFCRGYFLQTSNAFQPYTTAELATREVALEEQESAAQSQPTAASRGVPAQKRKVTGRVCVQCGATSTPQWREGPTGPKTLCNACGVRYGRAQAKAQKRSGHTSAGAASRSQQAAAAPTPTPSQRAATAGAASPPSRAKKGSKEVDTGGTQKSEQRPVRQAAQAALARTAAYARTGEFPDEEGDAMPTQPLNTSHAVRGRVADISHDSSHASAALESAENGAFSSHTQLPIAALELPPAVAVSAVDPPLAVPGIHTGLDSSTAAAKLMALSSVASGALNGVEQGGTASCEPSAALAVHNLVLPQSEDPLLALLSGAMQQALVAAPAPAVPVETTQGEYHQLALRAAKYLPELRPYEPLFAGLDALPTGALPVEVSQVLEDVRDKVDTANKESAAAEAAVNAVTQVFLARQQAAEHARLAATAAGLHLKQYLANLVEAHNLPALAGGVLPLVRTHDLPDGVGATGGPDSGLLLSSMGTQSLWGVQHGHLGSSSLPAAPSLMALLPPQPQLLLPGSEEAPLVADGLAQQQQTVLTPPEACAAQPGVGGTQAEDATRQANTERLECAHGAVAVA